MDFWRNDVIIHVAGIGGSFLFRRFCRFMPLIKDEAEPDRQEHDQQHRDVLKSLLAFKFHMALKFSMRSRFGLSRDNSGKLRRIERCHPTRRLLYARKKET